MTKLTKEGNDIPFITNKADGSPEIDLEVILSDDDKVAVINALLNTPWNVTHNEMVTPTSNYVLCGTKQSFRTETHDVEANLFTSDMHDRLVILIYSDINDKESDCVYMDFNGRKDVFFEYMYIGKIDKSTTEYRYVEVGVLWQ